MSTFQPFFNNIFAAFSTTVTSSTFASCQYQTHTLQSVEFAPHSMILSGIVLKSLTFILSPWRYFANSTLTLHWNVYVLIATHVLWRLGVFCRLRHSVRSEKGASAFFGPTVFPELSSLLSPRMLGSLQTNFGHLDIASDDGVRRTVARILRNCGTGQSDTHQCTGE